MKEDYIILFFRAISFTSLGRLNLCMITNMASTNDARMEVAIKTPMVPKGMARRMGR